MRTSLLTSVQTFFCRLLIILNRHIANIVEAAATVRGIFF